MLENIEAPDMLENIEAPEPQLWPLFAIASCLKFMIVPAYHSTDFEVHRNWLAITHSLPLKQWYYDTTSEWTLDYPPFFAYFEWILAKIAWFIDPQMLQLHNLNYASTATKYFQRISVMTMDLIFLWGVRRCIKVLQKIYLSRTGAQVAGVFLIFNIGLLFVDHIHFQYNGFLFGILLLSISYLLDEHYLKCAFLFACLLNFKHIFLYMAPAFGIYLLKFYCLDESKNFTTSFLKLLVVGLTPFVVSFGPFLKDLPQVLSRLFPFQRGLTHAYWAPNFWALYNTADKIAATVLGMRPAVSTTSGLVQDFDHAVLPSVRPMTTFVLTVVSMIPILMDLWKYNKKRDSKIAFLRSVVICSACSFMFGWHVHEKAILMSLLPLCFLFFVGTSDAKYAFMFSAVGYFSLFPLLFHADLLVIRYALYVAYMGFMYAQFVRSYHEYPAMNVLEHMHIYGLVLLPIYEHVISPVTGLKERLPFMPLLLYSMYCGLGVSYCFIRYYIYALGLNIPKKKPESKKKKNASTTKKLSSKKNAWRTSGIPKWTIEENIEKIIENSAKFTANKQRKNAKRIAEENTLQTEKAKTKIVVYGLPPYVDPMVMALKIPEALGIPMNDGDIDNAFWMNENMKKAMLLSFRSKSSRDEVMLKYKHCKSLKVSDILPTDNATRIKLSDYLSPNHLKLRSMCYYLQQEGKINHYELLVAEVKALVFDKNGESRVCSYDDLKIIDEGISDEDIEISRTIMQINKMSKM